MNNTYVPKLKDIEDKKWYLIDATDLTLGRLSTKVAEVLRGKHKVIFAPHVDLGDYVIIINADKVKVTGKKLDQKIYFHHTGWMGGGRYITLREMMKKDPTKVIEHSIRGMLPKGPLGRQMFRKLFVYKGSEHKHQAQKPSALSL